MKLGSEMTISFMKENYQIYIYVGMYDIQYRLSPIILTYLYYFLLGFLPHSSPGSRMDEKSSQPDKQGNERHEG